MPCCYDCSFALRASVPRLPKWALANDILMLREPRAFRSHGKRLSSMTFTMLALARMIVRKIIAEPYKKRNPSFKPKGLRSNTIAFPEARCRELITQALPAEPSVAAEYLADTISIALAGASPEDLEHAKWAQVPREAYMTAVRFCIAHSEAYADLNKDEVGSEVVAICLCAVIKLNINMAVAYR